MRAKKTSTRSRETVVADLNAGMRDFRGALIDLFGRAGVSAEKPLAMSRELGVDKTLAWKVSKVIHSPDTGAAFKHLPGVAGLEILFNAVTRRGGPAGTVAKARSAMRKINDLVERHVSGDRQTLELILDGLPVPSADRLLVSRRLAFRGNSGLWGVQAKTRINTAILAPSKTRKGFVDQATIGGWVDFRRLRSESRWALFRRHTTTGQTVTAREEPIDPEASADGPMLISEFCSRTMPAVEVVREPAGEVVYELAPGELGNAGAFTCMFGSIIRNIGPRQKEKADDIGWCGAVISAPVEQFQFDLLIHRDCAFALAATAKVYGSIARDGAHRSARDCLPLELPPLSLGTPASVHTTLVPRYDRLIERTMTRAGWNQDEFTGLRFTLECPPFPSSIVLSFPLES